MTFKMTVSYFTAEWRLFDSRYMLYT